MNLPPLVFLAEDDPDLRALFAAGIRRGGYDVVLASDGEEALAYFSSVSTSNRIRGSGVFVRAPDVILMDVRMPHRSGLELLLALRLAEWETPVILMTGFGDANVHARAEEFGAQAMLDKPVSSARLVREIDRLYSAAKLTSCPPAPKDDIVRAFDTASNDRARGCA